MGLVGFVLLWVGLAGCVPPTTTGDTLVAGQIVAGEPGNTWDSALAVSLPANGSISVSGSISGSGDVDVFDLGAVSAGDQIIVETEQSSGLDAAAGLFNDQEQVLIVNDDRSYTFGRTDPFISHIIRTDLAHCYLVVASSPYEPTTGSYTMTIQRRPNQSVPSPVGQAVLLDFDGATGVSIGSRAPINVPAFNAASIDSRYAGQTSQIIDIIEEMMREEYAPYAIDVYSTAEGDHPLGVYSTVYFGTYDAALLGLADSVDIYNASHSDDCIVYTDTFRLFMPLNPTLQQIATAIGNVATHEFGHLVGLYHTRDATEVMDITGSAQSLLRDQTLHDAPLERSVFPIGRQDPYLLLMAALGVRS